MRPFWSASERADIRLGGLPKAVFWGFDFDGILEAFWIAWQLGTQKECQDPLHVGSNLQDLTRHGTSSRGACEGRSESPGESSG